MTDNKNMNFKELLKYALLKTESKTANVLVFGDPNSGKKELINSILEQLNQKDNVFERIEEEETIKKSDNIYIIDYKFIRVNKFQEEDSDEIGKINFYIMNEKYKFFKQFIKPKMFKNLMIAIVLDLEKPAILTESFINWITFINNNFINYVYELDSDTRTVMQERFDSSLKKNRDIFTKDEEVQKNLSDPALDIEFSFGIPLLIIANKSDTLDNLREEKAIDHIQYTLRSMALKYGSTLIYSSSKLKSNINTTIDYLSYILLEKNSNKLKVQLNNDNLFIPVGFDKNEILNERFKDSIDYVFEKKNIMRKRKETETHPDDENILDVEEFLVGLKNEKIVYNVQNNISRKNQHKTSNRPTSNNRRSIFSDSTQKIMQILEGGNKKK